VMIEDLQRQVAELTQHLAAQNLKMYCDIDCRNSKSNFENLYHKPVLFQEQRVRDERHEDLNFRVKFVDEEFQHEDSSQCFVDWNFPPTYDTYVDDEDLIEVEENFIFKEKEIVYPFWEIYMPHEWEKINKYRVKIEVSQYDMKSFKLLFPIML
jgi:hypothetical protein